MTVKNTSADNVIGLSAELPRTFGDPVFFRFDVDPAHPLPPGKSISSLSGFLGPGGPANPLTISGSLQSGASFSYTRQVQIMDVPLSNERPVGVVSVLGQPAPSSSEGPVVEITLKNQSSEPIIILSSSMEVRYTTGGTRGGAFTVDFDVASANPLMPGRNVLARSVLSTGGFDRDTPFALAISGVLQDGTKFAYTEQVLISVPP